MSAGAPGTAAPPRAAGTTEPRKLFPAAPGGRSMLVLPHGTAGSTYCPSQPARSTAQCFPSASAEEQPGLPGAERASNSDTVPPWLRDFPCPSGTAPAAILLAAPLRGAGLGRVVPSARRGAGPGAAEPRLAMAGRRALWSGTVQLVALPSAAGWSGGTPQPYNSFYWRPSEPPPWKGWSGTMEEEEKGDETLQGRQQQPGR